MAAGGQRDNPVRGVAGATAWRLSIMPAVSRTAMLTPAMQGLLERIARAKRRPWHAMTPAEARAA